MMDIPFAALVTHAPRSGSWARRRCSGCPVLGTFFRGSAAFRSRATAPTARPCATRSRCSQAGEVLCVYPEGTRQHGPKIQPLQPGAAYLALRAGVPIIPVGIAGTEEILRTHTRPDPALRPGRRS